MVLSCMLSAESLSLETCNEGERAGDGSQKCQNMQLCGREDLRRNHSPGRKEQKLPLLKGLRALRSTSSVLWSSLRHVLRRADSSSFDEEKGVVEG